LPSLVRYEPLEREGRIVGGAPAPLGRYPYMASVRRPNVHFCSASIINNRWVLSTASCMFCPHIHTYRIHVGSVMLNSGSIIHTVVRRVNHPQYNADSQANDISVLQTAAPIVFNANVQPIAMGSALVGGGVTAIITGWGSTTVYGGPMSNQLQQLFTTTLTNANCRSRHTAANQQYIIDQKLCTFREPRQGICSTDHGGPVAAGNAIIGVIAWGGPCVNGVPDVHIRVSFFRQWILNTIG
jgi:trypsin